MKNYIEIERLQTVRIPIIPESWIEARNAIKDGELFDHEDLFDFNKEEVLREDYSYSDEKYRVVFDGQIKADCSDSGNWQFVRSK